LHHTKSKDCNTPDFHNSSFSLHISGKGNNLQAKQMQIHSIPSQKHKQNRFSKENNRASLLFNSFSVTLQPNSRKKNL